MSIALDRPHGGRASSLALRYALRELRGGLRGFYVFIACIALGVMAIAGVGSVAARMCGGAPGRRWISGAGSSSGTTTATAATPPPA